LSAFVVALLALLMLVGPRNVKATEGEIELSSTVGEATKCYAASVLMRDLFYNIVMSCRDLKYPANPDLFIYLVWATPSAGGKAVKLGDLGVGKAFFRTKTTFTNIFVTQENNVGAPTPSRNVSLYGDVKSLEFLRLPSTPTPIPDASQTTASPLPIPPEPKETIFSALKKAGLIFGGVVVLIVLVVIITRR